jgi:hypothetical protein
MYILAKPKPKKKCKEDNQEDFKRELGLLDGLCLWHSMIGSGIFIVARHGATTQQGG